MNILEGSTAPFDGQLLSTDLAIDLGQKAAFCDDRLKLELKFQKSTLGIEIALQKRLLEAEKQSCKAQTDLLLKRLEEAESRPWYEHPAFVATVAAGLTFLAVWGAVAVLRVTEQPQ